ncbi:MAG: hypothetical protein AAF388_08300 [Bacteroidota bacterium]
MRRILLFLLVSAGIALKPVHAQKWEEKLQSLRKSLDTKDEMVSKSWAMRLQQEWDTVKLEQTGKRWPQSKPSDPPALEGDDDSLIEKSFPIKIDAPQKLESHRVAPEESSPKSVNFDYVPSLSQREKMLLTREQTYGFFGSGVSVRYAPGLKFTLGSSPSKFIISQKWSQLQQAHGELVLFQLMKEAQERKLNDWGFCQLIHKSAKRLYPTDANARALYEIYMLSRAGYLSRLAKAGNRLYVLLPVKQTLYGATYLNVEGQKYYVMDFDGKAVNVSKAVALNLNYPSSNEMIDMRLTTLPDVGTHVLTRRLRFSYRGKTYNLSARMNKNLVHFFYSYPTTDWDVQLSMPASEHVRNSLVAQLKRIVRGKSEREAANMILRFVQTGLKYKTDDQQFGFENYLFAEETLYYAYSDCEDRSVLYSYLIQEVLGLEVIGLIFPGHAATAVKFRSQVPGTYLTYRGRKYVVCDPTYINSSVGMILPEVRNKNTQIVSI